MMDDEQVRINSDTTATHLVAPSIYGSWTIGSATGMKAYSTSPATGEGYITRLSMEHLENFATAVGGSATTYRTLYVDNAVSVAYGDIGAALCEAASEWSVEPEYYAAA